MKYFQNTSNYTKLLSHPSGRGSVSIPSGATVEGDYFQRYADLKFSDTLPKGSKLVYSQTEQTLVAPPVILPPVVTPYTPLESKEESEPEPETPPQEGTPELPKKRGRKKAEPAPE